MIKLSQWATRDGASQIHLRRNPNPVREPATAHRGLTTDPQRSTRFQAEPATFQIDRNLSHSWQLSAPSSRDQQTPVRSRRACPPDHRAQPEASTNYPPPARLGLGPGTAEPFASLRSLLPPLARSPVGGQGRECQFGSTPNDPQHRPDTVCHRAVRRQESAFRVGRCAPVRSSPLERARDRRRRADVPQYAERSVACRWQTLSGMEAWDSGK
jgi:hypothetical protein